MLSFKLQGNESFDTFLYNLRRVFMSWYNTYSDTTKKLDQLIDSQPSLQQLLEYPDFLELLRAYQPKLLEYITNSQEISRDLIRYITEPPLESDSDSRKYKLPLLTMLTIETNTICIINSFFRIEPNLQKPYFIVAFYEFLGTDQELLPLLCGYFSQFNLILWNNRYKQVVDLIYEAKEPLFLLAKHSYSKAIINTLLLYLNLDLTRNSNSPPERVVFKLQVIRLLFDQFREAYERSKKEKDDGRYEAILENIGDVFVEIVEKYFLIADGKSMLEIITSHENVALIIEIFMQGGSIALAISNVVGWLMRYYCFSSYNAEDPQNQQLNKRNQERLESQPYPRIIIELFPKVAEIINNATTLTLYHSKLIEIFNMALELSSKKLTETIKRVKWIEMLVSLLSRFPQLSIIHRMVEKVFYQMFNSERSVFEQYKKYLFCQANLIEITVGNYLAKIKDLNQFKASINSLHQGYFAYLMRIIKIYSKIQTNDDEINKSIQERSALWENFSTYILQPYEALCFKDLGVYEQVAEKSPVQYTIKCITGGMVNNQQISKKVLEEINREESMQKFKTQQSGKAAEDSKNGGLAEDTLFNVQEFSTSEEKKNDFQVNIAMPHNVSPDSFEHQLVPNPALQIQTPSPNVIISHFMSPQSPVIVEPKKLTEPEPINRKYDQFINTKKQEVDKELKMQRTNSSEKRLSANKARVTSPSPKKKRWDDSGNQEEEKPAPKLVAAPKIIENENKKQKISLTSPAMRPPMIPHSKPLTQSAQVKVEQKPEVVIKVSEPKTQPKQTEDNVNSSIILPPKLDAVKSDDSVQMKQSQLKKLNDRSVSSSQLIQRNALDNSRILSKSAINLNDLKNIQFKKERVLKPEKSEFRKMEDRDRLLLDFLGIKY